MMIAKSIFLLPGVFFLMTLCTKEGGNRSEMNMAEIARKPDSLAQEKEVAKTTFSRGRVMNYLPRPKEKGL